MKTELMQRILQRFLPKLEEVPLAFYESRRQLAAVSVFWSVVSFFGLCAAVIYYFLDYLYSASLSLGLGLVSLACLSHLLRTRNIQIPQYLAGFLLLPSAWALVATGGLWGTGNLWVLLYPVMLIAGLGMHFGLVYSLILYAGVLIIFLVPAEIAGWYHYDLLSKFQYSIVLLCITFFSWWAEFSRMRMQAELTDLARRMEISALQDILTGLGNRRDFYGRYEQEYARVARRDSPLSLCMCDIDAFRQFNEENGNECGDVALKYIAQILQNTLRKQDTVFYWGGGTFLVLLPEMNIEGTRIVAERLRYAVESQPLVYEGGLFSLTLSFGVRECDFSAPVDANVLAVDRKLYQAKQLGRNCVFG